MLIRYLLTIVSLFPAALTAKDNLPAYYEHINKAELAIMDGKYQDALSWYQSAFGQKEKLFAQDLHNAILCALKANNIPLAAEYAGQLADKGVGSAYFKQTLFAGLRTANNYNKLLRRADSAQAAWNKATKDIKEYLADLVDSDQYYHEIWSECVASDTCNREATYQLMHTKDKIYSKALKALFDEGKDLSEFGLGVCMLNDSVLSMHAMLNYDIIILHNYQGFGDADTLFSQVLRQNIFNGTMRPEMATTIMDNGSGVPGKPDYGNGARTFWLINDKLYRMKWYYSDSSKAKELAENRRDVMLYGMNGLQKRVLFKLHTRSRFSIQGIYAVNGNPRSNEAIPDYLEPAE